MSLRIMGIQQRKINRTKANNNNNMDSSTEEEMRWEKIMKFIIKMYSFNEEKIPWLISPKDINW